MINIATGQADDPYFIYLLDYPYFKGNHKLIAKDLSKQQAFDSNPKAIQQINFIGNLGEEATRVFIIAEVKKTYFGFFTRNRENILILFCFNIIWDYV